MLIIKLIYVRHEFALFVYRDSITCVEMRNVCLVICGLDICEHIIIPTRYLFFDEVSNKQKTSHIMMTFFVHSEV